MLKKPAFLKEVCISLCFIFCVMLRYINGYVGGTGVGRDRSGTE